MGTGIGSHGDIVASHSCTTSYWWSNSATGLEIFLLKLKTKL
jgi:hypothetical protein